MKKIKEAAWKKYLKCGKTANQVKIRYNMSEKQRCKCKECCIYYTIKPKKCEHPEETRKLASMYYSRVSGRGVGNVLGMNKSNVYHWIKKRWNERRAIIMYSRQAVWNGTNSIRMQSARRTARPVKTSM